MLVCLMHLAYFVWKWNLFAPFFPSIGPLKGIFRYVAIDGVLYET